MLLTVSTVKDSPESVSFFVTANLAAGIDHMVVFLDAPGEPGQDEVAELLDEHPHVTCLRTRPRQWWGGDRPGGLNVRQRINANWVRTVLEPLDWAEWLFHVDGDEVARVDRAALAAVPAGTDAVWLPPLEAVSEFSPAGRPTLFKHLLDDDDLALLHVLGVVTEPSNQHYFHGHVMGKSGVRPASGLALALHEALHPDGTAAPRHADDRLAVLHYDAISGEAFVRKWEALASAGHARFRASRQPTAKALRNLVARDLDADVRARYLRRVYDLTTADDVVTLGELGLLTEVDPLAEPLTPRPFPAGGREQLAARIAELAEVPKRDFYVEEKRGHASHQDRGASSTPAPLARLRRLGRGR